MWLMGGSAARRSPGAGRARGVRVGPRRARAEGGRADGVDTSGPHAHLATRTTRSIRMSPNCLRSKLYQFQWDSRKELN